MIEDELNMDTAARLLNRSKPAPMACCPKDGEPLISTLRWRGAEFFCMVCKTKYGFLSPTPKDVTPELQARHDELQEQFEREYPRA
jgi:hypothetical protein